MAVEDKPLLVVGRIEWQGRSFVVDLEGKFFSPDSAKAVLEPYNHTVRGDYKPVNCDEREGIRRSGQLRDVRDDRELGKGFVVGGRYYQSIE